MPAERRQRLDAIGFVWDALESRWEEGFAALKTFKAREGHCLVPADHVEGTFKLGQWVSNSAPEQKTLCPLNGSSGWMQSDLFGTRSKGHGKKALQR